MEVDHEGASGPSGDPFAEVHPSGSSWVGFGCWNASLDVVAAVAVYVAL